MTAARPPLSARKDPAAVEQYEALHPGMPGWMLQSASAWIKTYFVDSKGYPTANAIRELEQHLRVQLNWTGGTYEGSAALTSLLANVADHTFGPDVIDYCLGTCHPSDSRVPRMRSMLDASASAYTVGTDESGNFCLEDRVEPAAEAAARAEMAKTGKASRYLTAGWHATFGRSPNPSAAYHDAIRAVEAAARPIVTPNDDLATLGKMIAALKNGPATKWTTTIGDTDSVRQMMQTLWQAQHDRHGTDDESTPVTVSQEEAEAAIHLAVTLVQWFRSGAIRLSER